MALSGQSPRRNNLFAIGVTADISRWFLTAGIVSKYAELSYAELRPAELAVAAERKLNVNVPELTKGLERFYCVGKQCPSRAQSRCDKSEDGRGYK